MDDGNLASRIEINTDEATANDMLSGSVIDMPLPMFIGLKIGVDTHQDLTTLFWGDTAIPADLGLIDIVARIQSVLMICTSIMPLPTVID